jgi:hypothetical protein
MKRSYYAKSHCLYNRRTQNEDNSVCFRLTCSWFPVYVMTPGGRHTCWRCFNLSFHEFLYLFASFRCGLLASLRLQPSRYGYDSSSVRYTSFVPTPEHSVNPAKFSPLSEQWPQNLLDGNFHFMNTCVHSSVVLRYAVSYLLPKKQKWMPYMVVWNQIAFMRDILALAHTWAFTQGPQWCSA